MLQFYPGVREILSVELTKRIRCTQCGDQRNVKIRRPGLEQEPIPMILRIPKQGRKKLRDLTLEGMLASHFRDSIDWRCDDCSDAGPAPRIKSVGGRPLNEDNVWKKLCNAPEVLLLQIARFKGSGKRWTKDHAVVTIPQDLDLTQYLETKGLPPGRSATAKYKLSSVISHGGTRDGGHYVAFVCRKGQWYKFDDLAESRSTTAELANFDEITADSQNTPYVLCYEKVPEEVDQQSGADDGRANARAKSKSRSPSGGNANSKSPSQGGGNAISNNSPSQDRGVSGGPNALELAKGQGQTDGANGINGGPDQQLMHAMALVKEWLTRDIYQLHCRVDDMQELMCEAGIVPALKRALDADVYDYDYIADRPRAKRFRYFRPDGEWNSGSGSGGSNPEAEAKVGRLDKWSNEAVHNASQDSPLTLEEFIEQMDEEDVDVNMDMEEDKDEDGEDDDTDDDDEDMAGLGTVVSPLDKRDPVALLEQKREIDLEIFSKHYAASRSIMQNPNVPFWWMGPSHQKAFKKAVREYLDGWDRYAANTSLWRVAQEAKIGVPFYSTPIAYAMAEFEREFEVAQAIEAEKAYMLKLEREREKVLEEVLDQGSERQLELELKRSASSPSRVKTLSPKREDTPGSEAKSTSDILQWFYRRRGSSSEEERKSLKRRRHADDDGDSLISDPYAEATGSV